MKLKNKTAFLVKIGVMACVLALTACANKEVAVPKAVPSQDHSIQAKRTALIHQLEEKGNIQVIRMGEQVRIVLRSDYLFKPDSANLRESYKKQLIKVASLMRLYSKINVKVAAYSDNQSKTSFLKGLTTRQAQVVATFLWRAGSDTRLLYAVGYNKLNPVDSNDFASGQSYNRRVEISFTKAS